MLTTTFLMLATYPIHHAHRKCQERERSDTIVTWYVSGIKREEEAIELATNDVQFGARIVDVSVSEMEMVALYSRSTTF